MVGVDMFVPPQESLVLLAAFLGGLAFCAVVIIKTSLIIRSVSGQTLGFSLDG